MTPLNTQTVINIYLDVEFKEHPSWAKVFESTSFKASRGSQLPDSKNAIKWCIRMYNVYTHLYNTLIFPIIEYSSFIWDFKTEITITKIQINLMRSFLGVGRNASISSLLAIRDMGWLYQCQQLPNSLVLNSGYN